MNRNDPGATAGSERDLSIVINTYNRHDLLLNAFKSAAAQSDPVRELIVVDDGSTDDTPSLAGFLEAAGATMIRHVNMGLTASRNAGARASSTAWLGFLDDDDTLAVEWSAKLLNAVEPSSGIVFCGHTQVTAAGKVLGTRLPSPLGKVLGDAVGSYWPGTWIMRRDVFEEAGGYLDGLPFIHQFELLVRALEACKTQGLTVEHVDEPLLNYTVRDNDDRPMQWPQYALDGGRWILARHHTAFEQDPPSRANLEGVVGVAAARMGRLNLARRHLWRSARAQPTSPLRWARLAASATSPTAARAWGRYSAAASQTLPLPAVHGLPLSHQRAEDHLFLPWRYQRNPQASADALGNPYWEEPSRNNTLYQEPVYRYAGRIVRRRRLASTIDVGTGSGIKFERFVAAHAATMVGFDQGSGIDLARQRGGRIEWTDGDLMTRESWDGLDGRVFDLAICADVVEHIEDPVFLLHRLNEVIGARGHLLISTPDRIRFDRPNRLGPPDNHRHVREWTRDEFELLLESTGFEIVKRRRFLPRGYRPSMFELKRSVWRLLHRQAVPDRRSNIAFLCRRSRLVAYTPSGAGAGNGSGGVHREQPR
jgi:2-polyprenyl-3-methyl-5-hydroxy-6-metoxy-1,4-benzoquinol methylase